MATGRRSDLRIGGSTFYAIDQRDISGKIRFCFHDVCWVRWFVFAGDSPFGHALKNCILDAVLRFDLSYVFLEFLYPTNRFLSKAFTAKKNDRYLLVHCPTDCSYVGILAFPFVIFPRVIQGNVWPLTAVPGAMHLTVSFRSISSNRSRRWIERGLDSVQHKNCGQ